MKKPTSVDAYIDQAPPETKEKLTTLRSIIMSEVPDAVEKISYGMPYYGYKGRLAYFAVFKHHIGLYITPPIIADHQKELKGYVTATATVQFPLDKALPVTLIRKLISARKKLNDSRNY
jgi:uncharacterized protein YdhG (YjbR/CyaY superfamily)